MADAMAPSYHPPVMAWEVIRRVVIQELKDEGYTVAKLDILDDPGYIRPGDRVAIIEEIL